MSAAGRKYDWMQPMNLKGGDMNHGGGEEKETLNQSVFHHRHISLQNINHTGAEV